MAKRAIMAAAVLFSLLVAAMPGDAKGINRAHFVGPGLPAKGVALIRARGIQHSGLVASKQRSLTALGLDRAQLGTAYRATYRMDYAPRHKLRQIVYPYAEGGPVTFTPKGQHLGQDYESFRGGWYAAPPRLLKLLIAHGFPAHDPSDRPTPDNCYGQRASSAITPSNPWNRWGLPIAAMVLLPLATIIAVRKRRTIRGDAAVHRVSRENVSG